MPLKITLKDGSIVDDAREDAFGPEDVPRLRGEGVLLQVRDDTWIDPRDIMRVETIAENEGQVSAPTGPRSPSKWRPPG